MRKILILVAVSALLLGACVNSGASASPTVGNNGATGVNVSGEGRVTGTPDTMSITLGVSVLRQTVGAATGDAATLANAIIAAVRAQGVAEADLQTANYSIYPEYDWSGNRQRLTGYRVANELRVKVRDLDKAGAVIDAATAAGGDDVVVRGLSFSLEDNAELLEAARTAAWNDASAKARQLAELAGQRLGAAITITETVNSSTPPIFFERDAFAEAAATPIEPGQTDVVVMVQVTFAIG